MYFANFALSLLKTCSRLKVVEEEIQEPEDVRDLPVFIFLSLLSFYLCFICNTATHSTCPVKGNISTG